MGNLGLVATLSLLFWQTSSVKSRQLPTTKRHLHLSPPVPPNAKTIIQRCQILTLDGHFLALSNGHQIEMQISNACRTWGNDSRILTIREGCETTIHRGGWKALLLRTCLIRHCYIPVTLCAEHDVLYRAIQTLPWADTSHLHWTRAVAHVPKNTCAPACE